jgi:hypothetical protein
VWELAAMFEISMKEARTVFKRIDEVYESTVPLKRLCDELKNYLKVAKLDTLGFNAYSQYQ